MTYVSKIIVERSARSNKVDLRYSCKPALNHIRKFPLSFQGQRGNHFSLSVDPVILQSFVDYCEGVCELEINESLLEPNTYPNESWELDSVLRGYQRSGSEFLLNRKRVILADETGIGKSYTALGAAKALGKKTLFIGPKYILNKVSKTAEDVFGLSVARIYGDTKAQKLRACSEIDSADVVFTNYASVTPSIAPIFTRKWDAVILDEAQFIQGRKSKRTLQIKELINKVSKSEYVWLLTASPVWNRPDALWSLLNILDPKRFSSYWRFTYNFCHVVVNHFGTEIVGPKQSSMPVLRKILDEMMLRRCKRDVILELPPRIENEISLVPSNKLVTENRHIRKLMKENEGHVNLARLRSHLIDREVFDFKECERLYKSKIKPAKKEALQSIVKNHQGDKILVFVRFRKSAEAVGRWFEDFELDYYNKEPITGDICVEEREKIIEEFKESSGTSIMIGTPATMGVGINLQFANVVVFIEHPDLYSELDQCIGRIERIGADKIQTIYHVVQENTIDRRAFNNCMLKGAMVDQVLEEDY